MRQSIPHAKRFRKGFKRRKNDRTTFDSQKRLEKKGKKKGLNAKLPASFLREGRNWKGGGKE